MTKLISAEQFTEEEVIDRIIKGEKALYEIIIRRYNPTLYKVGRSYHFNHEDTQDLMQDTYLDAYKNLEKFEGRSGFKTWLIRIMLNNCYRRKEKSSFKYEVMQEVNDNDKPMFTDGNRDTERLLRTRELGQVIENALGQIPFDYRMVFALREINGVSVADTANLLNLSESNVKVRLNRAKSMLRKEVEQSYSAGELFEFNLIYCDAMVHNVMKKINEL